MSPGKNQRKRQSNFKLMSKKGIEKKRAREKNVSQLMFAANKNESETAGRNNNNYVSLRTLLALAG
jgi:hypothetical protein